MGTPTSPTPLLNLAHDAITGNPVALRSFLAAVHPMLRRYAARMLGDERDIPSDIAQEAVMRIAAGLPKLRAESEDQLIAWCLTVARNLCIDWLRRLRHEPSYGTPLAPYGSEARAHEDSPSTLELAMLLQVLVACEARLSAETRVILYLRVVEGATWTEIAHELGIAASAAKRRFQRAQRSLYRHVLSEVNTLTEPLRSAIIDRIRGFRVPSSDDVRDVSAP